MKIPIRCIFLCFVSHFCLVAETLHHSQYVVIERFSLWSSLETKLKKKLN